MTEIGQRVRRVREALGMSQTDFAQRMSYGRQHISSIERGQPAGKRFIEQLRVLEREVAMRSVNDANTSKADHPPNRGVVTAATGRVEESGSFVVSAPPHVLPNRLSSESAQPEATHKDYAEAVHILGRLMELSPDKFKIALATLRAMNQQLP